LRRCKSRERKVTGKGNQKGVSQPHIPIDCTARNTVKKFEAFLPEIFKGLHLDSRDLFYYDLLSTGHAKLAFNDCSILLKSACRHFCTDAWTNQKVSSF